jgi:hypothetical protein
MTDDQRKRFWFDPQTGGCGLFWAFQVTGAPFVFNDRDEASATMIPGTKRREEAA